jgi:AcrR family transcriptional regulator
MSSNESETRKRILETTWRLMVEGRGASVRMRDIAEAAGVSRQAVYLHFATRAELMVATARYIDEARGLNERLSQYRAATTGIEGLETFIEFWGNYIPEIYGLAKALLAVRETDEAAAAAWNDRMNSVRSGCRSIIETLHRDGMLAHEWSHEEAVDMLWTMLSIYNWENLTIECGWSNNQYVNWMQTLAKRTFVQGTVGKRSSQTSRSKRGPTNET